MFLIGAITAGAQGPGYCTAPSAGFAFVNNSPTSTTISWTAVPGITKYQVRYKAGTAATFKIVNVTTNSAVLPVAPCTGYLWRVRSVCIPADPAPVFSEMQGFQSSQLTYYHDMDGDHYGDIGTELQACAQPIGYLTIGGDCDGGNAAIHPNATETCDLIDNDCDGMTDEGVQNTYYTDADADAYGGTVVLACTQPVGTVLSPSGDCNDANAAVHPGVQETCNGIDDNCVSGVDETAFMLLPCLIVNPVCTGNANGTANIMAGSIFAGINVMAQFKFAWSDGQTTRKAKNLVAGTYTCVVTNIASGCTQLATAVLVDPAPVTATITTVAPSCYGLSNGSAKAIGTGGTGPKTYKWSTLATTATALALAAGTYTVTVMDVKGCTGMNMATVADGPSISVYADTDGDGFGDDASSILACAASIPSGYVTDNTDCDLAAFTYTDGDGDGFGTGTAIACGVADNTDCDDVNAAVNTATSESCNEIDDNCDGNMDEGVQTTYYADTDADGFGDAAATTMACSLPTGYVTDNTDCADTQWYYTDNDLDRFGVLPLSPCSGVTDHTDCDDTKWLYADADGDGFGANWGAPRGGALSVPPWATACGVENDDDCDDMVWLYTDNEGDGFGAGDPVACGITDHTDCDDAVFLYMDGEGDGFGAGDPVACGIADHTDCDDAHYTYDDADVDSFGDAAGLPAACGVYDHTDCNDADANIYPAAAEQCNGIDDNCDGAIDEGVATNYYVDADGDGYGAGDATLACSAPIGSVPDNTDCDDANAGINPAAAETCTAGTANGMDENCNGSIDEYAFTLTTPMLQDPSCTGGANGLVRQMSTIFFSTPAAVDSGYFSYNWLPNSSDLDRAARFLTAGTYTCTVTHISSGCTGVSVGVLDDPAPIVITQTLHTNVTCTPNSGAVTVSGSGGEPFPGPPTFYKYRWSNGKKTAGITGLAPGTYTVTVTGLGNCTATFSTVITGPTAQIAITTVDIYLVIPPPPAPMPNPPTYRAVIGISGGAAGQKKYSMDQITWKTGNTFTNLLAGNYNFYVRDINGCIASRLNVAVPVLPADGLVDDRIVTADEATSALFMFPNPATEILNVEIATGEAMNGSVLVTDVLGRIMLTTSVTLEEGEPMQIGLGQFETGTYNLVYRGTDGAKMNKRFMVIH